MLRQRMGESGLIRRNSVSNFLRLQIPYLCNSFERHINISKSSLFAGHSKWANIKHIKAAKDGEKASVFTKLSRQLRLALQEGGNADPALNAQLRSVMEEALRKNMPMATIQNVIKKFKNTKSDLKRYRIDLRYKRKVFMVCIIYTDNFAAVKMDIAPILKKSGSTIMDTNNIFEEVGIIEAFFDKTKGYNDCDLEDKVMEDAILVGAEDAEIINRETGLVNFICRPFEITAIRRSIESKGYIVDNAEHVYTPTVNVELIPEELVEYEKFITKIKNVSGVEDIYDNIRENINES